MADTQTKNWDDAIRAKRAALQDKIPQPWRLSSEILDTINETANFGVLQVPKTCGILTARELSLTEDYDATELVAMLREGKVKSEEVVAAFCKRSAIAQQLSNCLTEIMFDEAMQRAAELDRRIADGRGPIGPLHGLPISLKDSFNLKGVATTLGYVSFLDRPPAAHNSTVVDILLDLGAVPYVKTNIPQCMMSADSENHVFGRTLNPNRLCLTAGGSTGGEGALMALGGSVLGVCTDVGGSARIPAHCNGTIGFKPTAGRIPFFGGGLPGRPGNPGGIGVSLGPQTRTLRDVELFMRCVIDAGTWKYDQTALNVPWRRPGSLQRKLKLGLILEDPQRPLHPPQMKMMTKLTEALKAHGHEVVSIVDKVPSLWSTSQLAGKYFMLDPQKTPMKVLEAGGEKPIKSLLASPHPELRGWNASLDELWDMNVEKGKVIKAYHDVVVQHDLDAILLPPYQATAVPHDTWGAFIYTVLANMLEYPALVMPYLAASEEEDRAFLREGVVYEPPYTPKLVENAPCGFQLLGRPCGDEELLQVAEVIQQAISS